MAYRMGLTGHPATPDVLTFPGQCCRNQNIPSISTARLGQCHLSRTQYSNRSGISTLETVIFNFIIAVKLDYVIKAYRVSPADINLSGGCPVPGATIIAVPGTMDIFIVVNPAVNRITGINKIIHYRIRSIRKSSQAYWRKYLDFNTFTRSFIICIIQAYEPHIRINAIIIPSVVHNLCRVQRSKDRIRRHMEGLVI